MTVPIFEIFLLVGLITSGLISYFVLIYKPKPSKGVYTVRTWTFPFKKIWATYAISKWKKSLPKSQLSELPSTSQSKGWESIAIRTANPENGASIQVSIRKLHGKQPKTEAVLFLQLEDGTQYQLPSHPETIVEEWQDIDDGWHADGLKIQILEDIQRIRILYNGMLKCSDGTLRHTKLNLLWASGSTPYRHPHDWDNKLAANSLAMEPWKDNSWLSMLNCFSDECWLQWGSVQGRVQSFDINGVVEKSEWIRCRGTKEISRSLHSLTHLHRSLGLMMTARDGTMVFLTASSIKGALSQAITACVRYPNFAVESVYETDLYLPIFCENKETGFDTFTINLKTNFRAVQIVLKRNKTDKIFRGSPYEQEVSCISLVGSIDGEQAAGFLELGYQPQENQFPKTVLHSRTLRWVDEADNDAEMFCVGLDNKIAANPALVGGKGASLALLSSVQKQEGYKVPPGYCLTIHALNKQLEKNPPIKEAIQDIYKVNEDYEDKKLKDKCNIAFELLSSTKIVDQVKESILAHLKQLRKQALDIGIGDNGGLKFAVRSSAVGEDSEALSAAGQNDTILGCITDDDVIDAVKKCWASMYAYTSVNYRRQNGQPCACDGAVVIQCLVAPLAAGVLFTRSPDHGDPSRILITANYGLGESVVSGQVEPDTIIVKRDNDNLTIQEKILGTKTQRVTATEHGVQTEEVSETDRKKSCLDDKEVMLLANMAVRQEILWGAPRDIEWAICKDGLYLLQARPITSLERWTEEELLHEFDSAIMSDEELITLANLGEVMPKPYSAISVDIFMKTLNDAAKRSVFTSNCEYANTIIANHGRYMFDLYVTVYKLIPKTIDLTVKVSEMAVHGHLVADENILKIALKRNPPKFWVKPLLILNMFKFIFRANSYMLRAIKIAKSINTETESDDPLKILEKIKAINKNELSSVSQCHFITSAASSTSQLIAISILLENSEDFTTKQCSEIGIMLNSGGTISSEVPQGLAKISSLIYEMGQIEEFKKQEPKKAMTWLKETLPKVYNVVQEFLEQHGHRSIMEFDVATRPWILEPHQMIEVLQSMSPKPQENTTAVKTDAQIINSLETPKKDVTKKFLAWILPMCRRKVIQRESTKAHLILTIHKLRLLLMKLGKALVKEWYLPDENLVFYLRMHELEKLLDTRDPMLLRKALQRRTHMRNWDKMRFSELQFGWPKIEEPRATNFTSTSGAIIKGTPVCSGTVTARACVISDLNQIDQLQQGDILITYSTDIGWSPYFSLITAIATELGGLISHGAVIARECGLPCIVGANGATEVFKTGDMITFCGTTGTIQKVELVNTNQEPDSSSTC